MLKRERAAPGLPSLNEARAERRRALVLGKVRLRAMPPHFWLWTAVALGAFSVVYWRIAQGRVELRRGLLQALAILAAKPGYVGGDVGRNVDDPTLWVLTTRWENVGSYRRALGSYEGKLHIQPLMVHAVDEPSAYEVVEEGTDLNESQPRSIG